MLYLLRFKQATAERAAEIGAKLNIWSGIGARLPAIHHLRYMNGRIFAGGAKKVE
jgi:hypothetical protein